MRNRGNVHNPAGESRHPVVVDPRSKRALTHEHKFPGDFGQAGQRFQEQLEAFLRDETADVAHHNRFA